MAAKRKLEQSSIGVSSEDDPITHPEPPKKAELENTLKLVKKARSFHVTVDQKLDMVYLFYARELAVLEENAKHPDRPKKAAAARDFCAKMLGYSNKTVQNAVCEWKAKKSIEETIGSGNRTRKMTRVPHAASIIAKVRTFVRERRRLHQRTIAKDVLSFLADQGVATVGNSGPGYSCALRAVQRFLVRNGYKPGNKKGRHSIEEKAYIVEKRNNYLTQLLANRQLPPSQQLREVYVGESYIYHHYKRHDDSPYDPNDEQDLQSKELHNGKRYCFAAAIQGSDPREQASVAVQTDEQAGMVPNSLWIFEGNKQVKDFHDTFDSKSFLNWFNTQLLANLHQPSLIIMDGASYHKSFSKETPQPRTMKKDALQQLLTANGVAFDPSDRRPRLVELASRHLAHTLKPATVLAAEAQGHKVLFTPPFHSDLQPIELLWAHVKGVVGRKYQAGMSFQGVHNSLTAAFKSAQADSDLISDFIEQTKRVEDSFLVNGEVDDDEAVECEHKDVEPASDDEDADMDSDGEEEDGFSDGYSTSSDSENAH